MATFRGGTPTYGGDPTSGRPPGPGGPSNFGSAGALAQLPQCAVSLWGFFCSRLTTDIFVLDAAAPNIWYLCRSR